MWTTFLPDLPANNVADDVQTMRGGRMEDEPPILG